VRVLAREVGHRSTWCCLQHTLLWIDRIQHARSKAGSDALNATIEELADEAMTTESTIRRLLSAASGAGLIEVSEDRYRTGGQKENSYRLRMDAIAQIASRRRLFSEVCQAADPESDRGVTVTPPPVTVQGGPVTVTPPPVTVTGPIRNTPCIPRVDTRTSAPTTPPAGVPIPSESWAEAAGVLREIGLSKVQATITSAKAAGMAPQDLLDIANEFQSHRGEA